MKPILAKDPEQVIKDQACAQAIQAQYNDNLAGNKKATVKAKAQDAFNQIYRRYKSPIFYLALRFVKMNNEIAEDLTQEIFVKVYNKIQSYDPNTTFSTWLYTIAKNHCRDYKRTEKYEVMSVETLRTEYGGDEDVNESSFQLHDKSEDVFRTIIKSENVSLINRAIKKGIISSKARRVIRLIFLKELSYEETSQRMNLPLGTVKAFMFRGKKDIREYLCKKENFSYTE